MCDADVKTAASDGRVWFIEKHPAHTVIWENNEELPIHVLRVDWTL